MYLAEIRPNPATHVAVAACLGLAWAAAVLAFGSELGDARVWSAWGALALSVPVTIALLRVPELRAEHESAALSSSFDLVRLILTASMVLGVLSMFIGSNTRVSSYGGDAPPIVLGFAGFWFGIFAQVRLSRISTERRDAWREAQHRARHPELAPARRVGTPRYVDRTARLPRASDVLRERRRNLRWVDRALVAWMVLGLPLSLGVFGPAGVFAFPGIALVILAVQDHFERHASRGLRPPPDAEKRRRARGRLRESRGWWSASPPRVLVRMRAAFLLLSLLGWFFAALLPYLRGDDPAERYRALVPFVVGFLVGLLLLGLAEHAQVRREHAWLADRQEHRRRGR